MNEEIINRIRLILHTERLSETQFAKNIGMKQINVNRWLKGTPMPLEFILNICSTYPNISTEWLIRGTGDMYKDVSCNTQKTQSNSIFDKIMDLMSCGDEEFYEGQLEEKDKTIRSLNKRLNALETMLKALDKEMDKLEYDIDEETKYRLIADDAAPYNKSKV